MIMGFTSNRWVGEEDWTYRGNFRLLRSHLDADKIELDCEGLDTVAEVSINGVHVGNASNMFSRWEPLWKHGYIQSDQAHLGCEGSSAAWETNQRSSIQWKHSSCSFPVPRLLCAECVWKTGGGETEFFKWFKCGMTRWQRGIWFLPFVSLMCSREFAMPTTSGRCR